MYLTWRKGKQGTVKTVSDPQNVSYLKKMKTRDCQDCIWPKKCNLLEEEENKGLSRLYLTQKCILLEEEDNKGLSNLKDCIWPKECILPEEKENKGLSRPYLTQKTRDYQIIKTVSELKNVSYLRTSQATSTRGTSPIRAAAAIAPALAPAI